MKRLPSLAAIGIAMLTAPSALAQHAQVSAVAVDPNDSNHVWVCNRDNNTVSVIDIVAGTIVDEIPVGIMPRSLAFNAAGTEVFVANQRGNIPSDRNFVTPFLADGSEKRGTISVIDTTALTVTDTIDLVGTEPYGVVVAPNGEFLAVTGFRSGTVRFFDTDAPYGLLAEFQYDSNLNFLPSGVTMLDADEDRDFIADTGSPRFMTIAGSSDRVFVSHHVSPWVSVLDLALDVDGKPTSVSLTKKIGLDDYPFEQLVFDHNPGGSPVQVIKSQGRPRFLGDVALSPDGTRALVPSVLHNVNHDVNHNFGPSLAGDFANRVYPALTVIDAVNLSYNEVGDTSTRLHHELADPLDPAAYVHYGGRGFKDSDGVATLGGINQPVVNRGFGSVQLQVTGKVGLDLAVGILGVVETSIPMTNGTLLCEPIQIFQMFSGSKTFTIPDDPSLDGIEVCFQALIFKAPGYSTVNLSNGLRVRGAFTGYGALGDNKLGHRAGQPANVQWHGNTRALMLNRGSEDVFLYEVNGSDMRLMTVFPPRNHFVERAALDTTTPMGDLPLGMAMVDDASTVNDDSLVFIVNELTRTLSVLRVDWLTGVISKEASQITTISGPDQKTLSQRMGHELFEDSSRAQTAGNFNNSCASCHFEGGDDGNVWQRPAGPRSTMPVYGGTAGTGRVLWKAVRLNMGETGPMFGGENGGHGIFSTAEQIALIDAAEDFPAPLNPNLDQITGDLTPLAALGQDLFFGTNDTGLNPTGRQAGCLTCHLTEDLNDPFGETVRFFTADHVWSALVNDPEGVENLDPFCTTLAENLIGDAFRNVNSGVDIDTDNDLMPDIDRNVDGIDDRESYSAQNVDTDDDFSRDDPNGWPCPEDPDDPMGPQKLFTRQEKSFTIPTKLGVFTTGPYFHDHVAASLRTLLDPQLQADQSAIVDYDIDGIPGNDVHPLFFKYSDPSFPHLNKFINEFHDIRGNNAFVPGPNPNASKVQLDLRSAMEAVSNGVSVQVQMDNDVEALLAFIQSL